jgi:hypothetical protein
LNGSVEKAARLQRVKMGIVSIVDLPVLCHDRAGEVRTNL